MATDTQPLPAAAEALPETYRPASEQRGVSRVLRRFAGIREDILDWVPEERPRYTRLGIIIANTGVLAAASMIVALNNVTGVMWAWLVVPALVWGYIIISIDSSIVSSTHGVYSGKWRVYIPRLVISILIGAFIAEPLVLWFFKPAISTEVGKMRAQAVSAYQAKWVKCNPPDGTHPAGCTNYLLNLPGSPTTIALEIDHEKQLMTSVGKQISAIDNEVAKLQYTARAECSGASLPGGQTTGIVGQGQNCDQDRHDYLQYGSHHGLPTLLAQQAQYQGKVARLTQQLEKSQGSYGAQIQKGVAQQVALWQQGMGQPGLLDQDRALQVLSSQSGFVWLQEWLLRLLLIALDALPVLTKWFSRPTKYDKLYTRQLEAGDRLHEKKLDLVEREYTTTIDLKAKETEYSYHDGLADMAQRDRVSHGQRDLDQQSAIENLAEQLKAARRGNGPAPGPARFGGLEGR
jgi:hypothetical protein